MSNIDTTTTKDIILEKEDLARNYFRLLWLIHAEDDSKLDVNILYSLLPDINTFLNDPEKLDISTILMADQISEERFPMLTKGIDLILWYERTFYKRLHFEPCICTSYISRYLTSLAHIYAYLSTNKEQDNANACRMIRQLVAKYPVTSPIRQEEYYDMGPSQCQGAFNDIMGFNGYGFLTLNFFGRLRNNPELIKKVRNIQFETMEDLRCNEYLAYGVPYFMLLHFHLVFGLYNMWRAPNFAEVYGNIRVFDPKWREEVH